MKMVNMPGKSYARIFLSLSIMILFALTSCSEDLSGDLNDPVASLDSEELSVIMEEKMAETSYEDVDEIAFEVLEMTDGSSEGRAFSNPSSLRSSCATIHHDSVAKTIEVDFGTGCVGPDGKTRSGKILLSYTRRMYKPGASISLSFNNYAVDSLAIEGTRTLTNITSGAHAPFSLKATLVGGKITWPDGSMATREYTRTRTWIRGVNFSQDEFHVNGALRGTTRAGDSYSTKIISTLIIKRKCRWQGVNIPVQGIKVIERSGKPNLLIDFGDGTCDHLITVTKKGHSKVIDLSQ